MSTSKNPARPRPSDTEAEAASDGPGGIRLVTLGAHDPLPDGPSVVLMRRLAEADPRGSVVELIVTGDDREERATTLADAAGDPVSWDDALQTAAHQAASHGIDRLFVIDRTEGKLEHEATAHHGDRTFEGTELADADPEDGVRGSDMRDGIGNAAPRKF